MDNHRASVSSTPLHQPGFCRMRSLLLPLACTLVSLAIAGCGLIYHPPLQQGNLVNKETVAKLKPGMTKRQVMVLMGSPSIASPFDHDRWDYVHAFAINGGKMQIRKMTLFFNNDTLVRTEGSLHEANNQEMLKQAQKYKAAEGGKANQKKGDKSDDDD